MTRPPAEDPPLPELVEELSSHCATLRESLQALQRVPADEVEDALWRHLEVIRPLCMRVTELARMLAGRRAQLDGLRPPVREEVIARLSECRDTVERADADYGRLAEDVGDVLDVVRARLRKIQQGGKLLRGYRRSARIRR